ncbi:MAG: hypothetical protein R6V39_04255, partial [Desulfovibrionales bacterium]
IDRERRQVVTAPLHDERGREIVARHAIRYDWLVLACPLELTAIFMAGTPLRKKCIFKIKYAPDIPAYFKNPSIDTETPNYFQGRVSGT